MLAYLDALVTALCARDVTEMTRLLEHPLVRILSPDARAEAELFLAGHADDKAAPLRVMQSRHQTAQVLRDGSEAEELLEEFLAGRTLPLGLLGMREASQMEFSLSA